MLFYCGLKYKLKLFYNSNLNIYSLNYIRYITYPSIVNYYIKLYGQIYNEYIIKYVIQLNKYCHYNLLSYNYVNYIIYNYTNIKCFILKYNYLILEDKISAQFIFFFNSFCIKIMLNVCFILNLFIYLYNKFMVLYSDCSNWLLSYIKNSLNSYLNAYAWYLNLISKFNFHNYAIWLFIIDYFKVQMFIKLILFKANSINFNLNNFFFYKFYIKSLFGYYIDILFKIKNKMVYYKSNYFYFRRPRTLRKLRKYKTRLSRTFLNVRTRRHYNSFYNLTINSFFLKNLYSLNLNTYIYI